MNSAYAQFLQPNNSAREAINSGDGTASLIYQSVLPNGMYYISGAYEMTALWDRPDGQEHAKGQLLFLPFVRAISLLLAPDLFTGFDIQQYVYRDGVFQTFFGPLWVNFGWFGPLVMALLGFIVQRLAVNMRRGSVGDLPIYCFLAVVIFFMPVTNLLVNGLGMFCVIAFVAFAVYARARSPTRRCGGPEAPPEPVTPARRDCKRLEAAAISYRRPETRFLAIGRRSRAWGRFDCPRTDMIEDREFYDKDVPLEVIPEWSSDVVRWAENWVTEARRWFAGRTDVGCSISARAVARPR